LDLLVWVFKFISCKNVDYVSVQGFKVPFSSLDCIRDAYLRKEPQLRQA
jgi:hypothetical protein